MAQTDHQNTNQPGVIGDAFLIFVLFALWLWQFETTDATSLYHWAIVAIGLIAAVGIGIMGLFILAGVFSSRRDKS